MPVGFEKARIVGQFDDIQDGRRHFAFLLIAIERVYKFKDFLHIQTTLSSKLCHANFISVKA